jgi:uncharacterized protein YeaO (DUF488 family)
MVKLKRAYDPAEKADGYRVLVDRLWPRGIRKSDLVFDEWAKELSPSTELRKEFGHDPERWKEFRAHFQKELHAPELRKKIDALAALAQRKTVTLLYSARDEEHNNAVVLRDVITRRMNAGGVTRSEPNPCH